jgi:hypothetical protein
MLTGSHIAESSELNEGMAAVVVDFERPEAEGHQPPLRAEVTCIDEVE